jgi:hypothetical protein
VLRLSARSLNTYVQSLILGSVTSPHVILLSGLVTLDCWPSGDAIPPHDVLHFYASADHGLDLGLGHS